MHLFSPSFFHQVGEGRIMVFLWPQACYHGRALSQLLLSAAQLWSMHVVGDGQGMNPATQPFCLLTQLLEWAASMKNMQTFLPKFPSLYCHHRSKNMLIHLGGEHKERAFAKGTNSFGFSVTNTTSPHFCSTPPYIPITWVLCESSTTVSCSVWLSSPLHYWAPWQHGLSPTLLISDAICLTTPE